VVGEYHVLRSGTDATGEEAPVTKTSRVRVVAVPSGDVAVAVTGYRPSWVNTWLATRPATLHAPPSPNVHRYVLTRPGAYALKRTGVPATAVSGP